MARSILQGEHDLKQRRMTQVACRLQLFHQHLEWQVLMSIGRQCLSLTLCSRSRNDEVVAEYRSQHQCVDEEADQRFDLGTIAISDGRAHRDV